MGHVLKKYVKKAIAHTSARTNAWGKNSGMKVLIHCIAGFEKEIWNKLIDQEYPMLLSNTNFRFVDSKLEFLKLIGQAEAVFTDDVEDIHLAKKAKCYQVPLTGIDYVEQYTPSRVPLVTSQGLASRSVAEYVLGFLLVHAKQITHAVDDTLNRRWSQEYYFDTLRMLHSLKVGIIGYGAIGKEIASLLEPFQTQLFLVDTTFDTLHISSDRRLYCKSIEEVPDTLDYLVIALPLLNRTKHLVGRKYFEKLGPRGVLINISRGEVIHEDELIHALKNHQIGGAVLDVLSKEPAKSTAKIWDCPNLIITPHISGNIYFIKENIMRRFLENIRAVSERRDLTGRVHF